MKSNRPGTSISEIEIVNVSKHGFWLLVDEKEYFLPFSDFPWFKNVRLNELFNVERLYNDHLFWPALDVDITLDMIKHPDKYPLVFK